VLDPRCGRGRGAPPDKRGGLDPRHRRGRGVPPERRGELEPCHRRGEGILNHATGEGRGPPIAPQATANYYNYFNIFTSNNTPIMKDSI
jgi:hypothetical protein